MRRSYPILLATLFAIAAAACSSESATRQNQPALPVVTVRTATLDITPGIKVLARIALPDGFAPAPGRPPMWLQGGKEVAVAGVRDGGTMIMGYSGPGWRKERVLAQDGGAGGKDARIADVAPSADGMELALAVADTRNKRVDVILRDLISSGEGHPLSSFDGEFDSISIGWLERFTIALALRAREPAGNGAGIASAHTQARAAEQAPADGPSTAATASGIYLIGINGMVTAEFVKLNCKLSRLVWSPQGDCAAGEGDAIAPPVWIDRQKPSCRRLNANPPIRVLGWSRDGYAFLYQELEPNGDVAVSRYDIRNQTAQLVAISSGAAAFAANDKVLALGNSALRFRRVREAPNAPVQAELALSDPRDAEVDIESLGFNTTPAMLAESTMTYTRSANAAAIATFSPAPTGPVRRIVTYSVADKSAFLLAFGPARGPATMSWSPRGRYLAIADGDSAGSALTIVEPAR